jgi:hypothetical protein
MFIFIYMKKWTRRWTLDLDMDVDMDNDNDNDMDKEMNITIKRFGCQISGYRYLT